jgi:hypothetical protein
MLLLAHLSVLYDSEGLLFVLVTQQGCSWHSDSLCLTGIDGIVHQGGGVKGVHTHNRIRMCTKKSCLLLLFKKLS